MNTMELGKIIESLSHLEWSLVHYGMAHHRNMYGMDFLPTPFRTRIL